MEEVKALLTKQNEILMDNQNMLSKSIEEFMRILKLQASESGVLNSRLAIMEATQEKLLQGIADLGTTSKALLSEWKKN